MYVGAALVADEQPDLVQPGEGAQSQRDGIGTPGKTLSRGSKASSPTWISKAWARSLVRSIESRRALGPDPE